MNHKLRFHDIANRELVSLYNYIADQSGEDRAWAYVSGIRKFCFDLTFFPSRGTERTEIASGLRIIGYKHSATIVFFVDATEVFIVGIFYGGKNIRFEDIRKRIAEDRK